MLKKCVIRYTLFLVNFSFYILKVRYITLYCKLKLNCYFIKIYIAYKILHTYLGFLCDIFSVTPCYCVLSS